MPVRNIVFVQVGSPQYFWGSRLAMVVTGFSPSPRIRSNSKMIIKETINATVDIVVPVVFVVVVVAILIATGIIK